MNQETKETFFNNVKWFNDFFSDIYEVFKVTRKQIEKEFNLKKDLYYYPKSNYVPTVPEYYCLLVGGGAFVVQVILNVSENLLMDHPYFENEPSLVVVRIDDFERYGLVEDYGYRVLAWSNIEDDERSGDLVTGKLMFKDTDEKLQFKAFQVPLDQFKAGMSLEECVYNEIVMRLR